MGWLRWLVLGRRDGIRAALVRSVRAKVQRCRTVSSRSDDARSPIPEPRAGVSARREGGETGDVGTLPVGDVPPGSMREIRVAGRYVVVVNLAGTFHAVGGTCPHAGGPLAEGRLEGPILTCPNHGWSFDVRGGACLVDPSRSLEVLPVRVIDGRVVVGGP